MVYVIASSAQWYKDLPYKLAASLKADFIYLNDPQDLTLQRLATIQPRYVFFPHWSYLIPAEIYHNYECIIFHMTDVPFGRGGSPLQNLIARGIYETKISALKCQEGIDAGPVYRKRPFSLYGTGEEIYLRAAQVVEEMIAEIIVNEPVPVNQEGEIVYFARRKPKDGNLEGLEELEQVFDYIRMLDADGYPKAFIETQYLRLEFERASLKAGSLIADVRITKRESKNE